MAKTREQRNAARREMYAENKMRIEACNKFSGEIMWHETARVLDYLECCIRENRPAKLDERPLWTTNSQLDGSDA